MSCRPSGTAWRGCLAPLRQEASARGFVAHANLRAVIEALRPADADLQEYELVEDLSFLAQQLIGLHASLEAVSGGSASRDGTAARIALCRLLAAVPTVRTVRLHGRAANLILGALRQWADTSSDDIATPSSPKANAPYRAAPGPPGPDKSSAGLGAGPDGQHAPTAHDAVLASGSGLQLEALAALAALLPSHLCLLSEHERAAQLAALHSLVTPPPPPPQQQQQQRGREGSRARLADVFECQTLALTILACCCGRVSAAGGAPGGGAGAPLVAAAGGGAAVGSSTLTPDEAAALLSAAVALLHSCACRSRPVEDAAHSRMYAALVRAVQAAVGDAKQAWVSRAALLVEGLQRFLTYGVQASLQSAAPVSAPSPGPAAPGPPGSSPSGAAGALPSQVVASTSVGSIGAGRSAAAGPDGGGGGGRYRPPHLRRRESQADGAASCCSDSDLSDTEHPGGGGRGGSQGAGGGAGIAAVDRFRSSRVRLGVLTCIQTMAKSDPRAMHTHWAALLPLHAPLQPRPLTPHLLTVLLFDPLTKVRAQAAATISTLVDGPAPRAILAVAEAKSMSARPPVRGFLTLSLSLGQLLLAAHAGLLHSVAGESSTVVLPGVLRALVALITATPYERLPPELLPDVVKVLRTRWAAMSASPAAGGAEAELAPIHAAYLACLAECFATKQPIAGLAGYLQQHQHQQRLCHPSTPAGWGTSPDSGEGGGDVAEQLVQELLAVGRNPAAAAVLRIEAVGALKGLAAHYVLALPAAVWDNLRAAAELGLSSAPSPRGSRTPSRTPSSSSLPAAGGLARARSPASSRTRGVPPAAEVAAGPATSTMGASSTSPEDKAAQLSVKLVSEYLASVARHHGIARPDAAAGGAGEDEGGSAPPLPAARASHGYVPLGPAALRQSSSQSQAAVVSPAGAPGARSGGPTEEERVMAVRRLAGMWTDAAALLVPAATEHATYMVRSAALACLGEVPEPVFAALPPQLQQRLLGVLSEAAAADSIPAVRAAACKALGATAAFPAVLAHAGLSGGATRALLGCLRDSVLSVRIAAGWAVANLCDAYRRLFGDAAAGAQDPEGGQRTTPSPLSVECQQQQQQQQRIESNTQASTRSSAGAAWRTAPTTAGRSAGPAASPSGAALAPPPPQQQPKLEPHQYRQLALLCNAAITATQDADKVRANGIRAVGNLLAFLVPDMAPDLEAASTSAAGGSNGSASRVGTGGAALNGPRAETQQGPWPQGRRQGEAAGNAGGSRRDGRSPAGGAWTANLGSAGRGPNQGGGASTGGDAADAAAVHVHLDAWLDHALACLQSSLTTGGMKVQWNACYAVLGLLRNTGLLAHPRVALRTAPLLLLLVMLVRESANFKIRTHAAAALAALPTREAYADILPDALLVVAAALEGLASGGTGAAAAAPALPAAGGKPGPGNSSGAEQAAEGAEGPGDAREGRFPNFRYTAGLSSQLRATLLHLLALAQPADARRVRDALARRADFLHTCLKEQLAEAVRPLQALSGQDGLPRAMRPDGPLPEELCGGLDTRPAGLNSKGAVGEDVVGGGGARPGGVAAHLPLDPFGLSGSGAGRGAVPLDGSGSGGLVGLLAGFCRSTDGPCRPAFPDARRSNGVWGRGPPPLGGGSASGAAARDGGAAAGGAWRDRLAVQVPPCDGGTDNKDEEVEARQAAAAQVAALAAPLRGFAALLTQVGPSGEALLRDVQAALVAMGSSRDGVGS